MILKIISLFDYCKECHIILSNTQKYLNITLFQLHKNVNLVFKSLLFLPFDEGLVSSLSTPECLATVLLLLIFNKHLMLHSPVKESSPF